MFLDEPAVVVAVLEVEQGQAKVLDSLKGFHPQQLLLQRSHEPLSNPVAFVFLDHEVMPLTNNQAERELRGVVLTR